MRRTTVYPGAVPLELDLLNTNKQTMISVGHVLQDMLGTGTLFSGLGCVPTGPAGMTVNVNPGRAYSLQSTDTGAYSSLAADATPVMKQGILLNLVNFACPAPTTAGFSQNYLIEGAFQEVDGGNTVLPYYNAANPAVAFSGPAGAGTSNTTYRDNTVQLQLKAGAAATTGSQVTPTPDSGFTGLWVVTVAFGQVTITSTSIAQYVGAPFLSASLLSQIQAPIPGRLLKVTVFSTPGTSTFTSLAATNLIIAEVIGGGGGAGGNAAQGTGTISVAAGGGGGAYCKGSFNSGFSGGLTVTVGAVGVGGTGGLGGSAGGASSVGALITAPGGRASNAGVGIASASAGGLAIGALSSLQGSGGTIFSSLGAPGGHGYYVGGSLVGGNGGASGLGNAGPTGQGGNTPGQTALAGFGCGGSGGAVNASSAANNGGSGAGGYVVIYEFS